jgi:hypothetical protein
MADDDQFGTKDDNQGGNPWDVQNPDTGPGPYGSRSPGRPWFGPKRFGYGLSPRSWQGWLITAGVVAVAVVVSLTTHARHSDSPTPFAIIAIAAVLIIRVVFMVQRRR